MLMGVVALMVPALTVAAHGGELEAVVEAAAVDGGFEYGLSLHSHDGHPVTGALVVIRAEKNGLVEVADPNEIAAGLYVGRLALSSPGDWEVVIAIDHPESSGSISFTHSITAADHGYWEVLADTANPERVGSVPDPATSILDPPVLPTTTSLGTTSSTSSEGSTAEVSSTTSLPAEQGTSTATGVVVDISGQGPNPGLHISLRIIHVVAIGMWLIPVFASLFGATSRARVVTAISGVVLTAVTGTTLMLLGTPVPFPGLFRWSGFASIPYGPSYLGAFTLKLVGVIVAVVATVRWAAKSDLAAARVTLAAGGLAVIAVIALSQFHILSHF